MVIQAFWRDPAEVRGRYKVIGGSAVGQRERVVLVEVADTWLVVGVAPGHVTALHSMPKGEITTGTADTVGGASTDHRFSAWFKKTMEKRNGNAMVNSSFPSAARMVLGAVLGTVLLAAPLFALAQNPGLPAFTSTPAPGGGQNYSLSLQTLLLLTSLTFLPAALLMMTGFTRIIIVLSLLRQALGTQSSPPNQVLVGLALFLTFFVMGPVFDKIYENAYEPYTSNKITMSEALDRGAAPLKAFMMKQTREADLALFVKLSGVEQLNGRKTCHCAYWSRPLSQAN